MMKKVVRRLGHGALGTGVWFLVFWILYAVWPTMPDVLGVGMIFALLGNWIAAFRGDFESKSTSEPPGSSQRVGSSLRKKRFLGAGAILLLGSLLFIPAAFLPDPIGGPIRIVLIVGVVALVARFLLGFEDVFLEGSAGGSGKTDTDEKVDR